MKKYLLKNIAEVSQLLDKGVITTHDLLKMCLQNIKDSKSLNAFITVNDAVLNNDKLKEQDKQNGRNNFLRGIPISVKDNFCTRGILTSCASKMLSNFIPPYNATVVQKLEDSGALMIGKTNMDEFALGSGSIDSHYGPTKNPWRSKLKYRLWKCAKSQYIENENPPNKNGDKDSDEDFFIPGGSSGGSAVAVATGCCFGSLGTDTGGSTRMPAAKCGVVGLKPTYGRLSRHGMIPLCNFLDAPGIITRSIDDAALLLNCIQGWDPHDSTMNKIDFNMCQLPSEPSMKELHIGLPKEYDIPNLSPEVHDLWMNAADMLDAAGAKISYVSLPYTEYSIVCYTILSCCDIASNFARYDGLKFGHRAEEQPSADQLFALTRREGFGDVVRSRILTGNFFLLKENYENYFLKAAKVRRLITEDFDKAFNSGINVLLTPVTVGDAVRYSEWIKKDNRQNTITEDYFTQPVNLAGLPAVSVPCKLSKKGLPLSLQLIGRSFQEQTMLSVAKWIEVNFDFPLLELYND